LLLAARFCLARMKSGPRKSSCHILFIGRLPTRCTEYQANVFRKFDVPNDQPVVILQGELSGNSVAFSGAGWTGTIAGGHFKATKGDCKIHVEFRNLGGPTNSGVYIQDRYEANINEVYGRWMAIPALDSTTAPQRARGQGFAARGRRSTGRPWTSISTPRSSMRVERKRITAVFPPAEWPPVHGKNARKNAVMAGKNACSTRRRPTLTVRTGAAGPGTSDNAIPLDSLFVGTV
jgi:hypothetical protein